MGNRKAPSLSCNHNFFRLMSHSDNKSNHANSLQLAHSFSMFQTGDLFTKGTDIPDVSCDPKLFPTRTISRPVAADELCSMLQRVGCVAHRDAVHLSAQSSVLTASFAIQTASLCRSSRLLSVWSGAIPAPCVLQPCRSPGPRRHGAFHCVCRA